MLNEDLITRDPEIMSGTPVFKGTRVPIKSLFDYLRGGDTLDEFLESFPSVEREQAEALIESAGEFGTMSK
ncbi:MAG: DUF433 domain-containing protein [Chloroflexota bacterium]|nr:DUF433 domain-containing protein [Chloroflexota bacterium]MDQ5866187.1 DUF433 domain-containing protein [Chloroflexota bacterium]